MCHAMQLLNLNINRIKINYIMNNSSNNILLNKIKVRLSRKLRELNSQIKEKISTI